MGSKNTKADGGFVLDTVWKRVLYKITMVVGIIGPLGNVPQIIKIYTTKNVGGVSILTWIISTIFDVPFILWGILRKDMPVFVTYFLWFLSNLIVVIGISIYSQGFYN